MQGSVCNKDQFKLNLAPIQILLKKPCFVLLKKNFSVNKGNRCKIFSPRSCFFAFATRRCKSNNFTVEERERAEIVRKSKFLIKVIFLIVCFKYSFIGYYFPVGRFT